MPFPWTNYSHLSIQSKFCCIFHPTPFNRYSCHFWLFTIVNLTVTWYLESNVPIIWKCPSQLFVLISELLLQIVHGSVNSDNATLELNSLQPSIYHTDKFVVGNPKVIQSPVGMGIRCTADTVWLSCILSQSRCFVHLISASARMASLSPCGFERNHRCQTCIRSIRR